MTDDHDPADETKPDRPGPPQLQLAIRLLSTPTSELPRVIAEWQAAHPGAIEPLAAGEPDPDDERERDLAAEAGVEPWFYGDDEPYPPRGADVWIFGDPPRARANGRALPRLVAVFDDRTMTRSAADVHHASWLVRGLRQRARSYERVVAGLLGLAPGLADEPDPAKLPHVAFRALAAAVGLHESTVRRVVPVCRVQTRHGVVRFAGAPGGDAIAFRLE